MQLTLPSMDRMLHSNTKLSLHKINSLNIFIVVGWFVYLCFFLFQVFSCLMHWFLFLSKAHVLFSTRKGENVCYHLDSDKILI